MFNPTAVVIDAFVAELREGYVRTYTNLEPDYPGIIDFVGHMALELIANSDAPYHDLNHTICVTLVGQEVLNGKPLRNASVVMHPVGKSGKQSRGGLELKCDAEGKASFDGVPYGKLRIQVLAPGFQTYGEDFDIDKPVEEITVKMKRPTEQYSIYKDNQNEKKDDPPKDDPPKAESEKEQPK